MEEKDILYSVILVLIIMVVFYIMNKTGNTGFKPVFLVIVVVLFILGLIYVFYKTDEEASKRNWPPSISKCPDYWVQDLTSDQTICTNVKNLGLETNSCPTPLNVDTFIYESKLLSQDDCAKALWARSCNLTWDGITNNEKVCG